jgi:hypothetical protein
LPEENVALQHALIFAAEGNTTLCTNVIGVDSHPHVRIRLCSQGPRKRQQKGSAARERRFDFLRCLDILCSCPQRKIS